MATRRQRRWEERSTECRGCSRPRNRRHKRISNAPAGRPAHDASAPMRAPLREEDRCAGLESIRACVEDADPVVAAITHNSRCDSRATIASRGGEYAAADDAGTVASARTAAAGLRLAPRAV